MRKSHLDDAIVGGEHHADALGGKRRDRREPRRERVDEEEGDRDGRARAVAPNEEDESFVEELTPEEEDELAEFERLEREVAAEVGAA